MKRERVAEVGLLGGLVITPGELREYMDEVDLGITSLVTDVNKSEKLFSAIADGFDYWELTAFFTKWRAFYGENVGAILDAGDLYDETERYHIQYKGFRKDALRHKLTSGVDPIGPPEPLDSDSGIAGYVKAAVVIGGLFAVGYVIRGVR